MEKTLENLGSLLSPAMADLMKRFVEKKNLNDRVQIRLQMKALLDFASADTEFPPNPITQKDPRAQMGDNSGMQIGTAGSFSPIINTQAPGGYMALASPVPIPAARPVDNSDILG